jgi:G3E family GTPase
MAHPTAVDLIVLSGFLGSGKTTLLLDFLKQDAMHDDTGVIVNEVGEIGVDGAIVADGSDDVPLTPLANGCVCCSFRSGLVHTVSALLDAPRPADTPALRRIILETSGLSRPGPIIASLADPELVGLGVRVSVVTTYDCTRGEWLSEQFDEAAAQFAAAQRIVLTKTDQVGDQEFEQHRQRAQALNPLAHVMRTKTVRPWLPACSTIWLVNANELAVQGLRASGLAALRHPRIHVIKSVPKESVSWTDFSEWLDDLAGLCGERLLRLKAMLHVTDCEEPILIQSVGTTFSALRRMMNGAAQDAIILITRDIDQQYIQASMPASVVELSTLG